MYCIFDRQKIDTVVRAVLLGFTQLPQFSMDRIFELKLQQPSLPWRKTTDDATADVPMIIGSSQLSHPPPHVRASPPSLPWRTTADDATADVPIIIGSAQLSHPPHVRASLHTHRRHRPTTTLPISVIIPLWIPPHFAGPADAAAACHAEGEARHA